MATYPATDNLADLNEANPQGSETASAIDEALRETRLALKTVIKKQHKDDGTHADDFLTFAMLPTATKEAIADMLAGNGLTATAAALGLALDDNFFEIDTNGNLSIKSSADLTAFVTAIATGAVTIDKTSHGAGSGGSSKIWIQQSDGTLAAKALGGAIAMDSNGNVQLLASFPTAIVQDRRGAGVHGGTFTSGSWVTRGINSEQIDSQNILSLSSNQITLEEGTYLVLGYSAALMVGGHKARLYNVTDSNVITLGSTEYSQMDLTRSQISQIFTVGEAKALELQHRCETTKSNIGFGRGANFDEEVFAELTFIQLA